MAIRSETPNAPSPKLQSAKAQSEKCMARLRDLENHTYQRKTKPDDILGRQGNNIPPARELRGNQHDFEMVEGREDDIMGLLKGRVPKQHKARQNVEAKGKGRSDGRVPDLTIPIARERRLATPDGRTSFHFSHDAVSKINKRTVGDDGRVNQPFAAKAHNTYIERTEAVAIDDAQLEANSVALESVAFNDVPGSTVGLAAAQGIYIERQEALALQPDGTRVLFTNIDDDPDKRSEYWHLVEKHERDADPDKITFQVSNHPVYWKSVRDNAGCPDDLKRIIGTADPEKPVTVKTEDNIAMRAFLSQQDGFIPVPKKRPGERAKDYQERCRPAHDLVKFHDGRGGRIQYRIIGELPHELTVAGRAAILYDFAQEFEKRKLPFVAVMHAPDHTNNDKNWHFHLVYHDRPASRVTQEMIDIYKAQKGRPSDDLVAGAWDFTVEDHEHDKKNWNNRKIYPFRQDKVHEVTRSITESIIDQNGVTSKRVTKSHNWIHDLRDKLAAITNEHLARAGVERRVDPRRHEEMGIDAYPQEHLGTKLSNLEAMGVATPQGISNEDRQWNAIMQNLEANLERQRRIVDKEINHYLTKIDNADLTDEDKIVGRSDATRWRKAQNEAHEHDAIAQRLIEHMERAQSRARKVAATAVKNLGAIEAGKASRYLTSRQTQLMQKRDEALEYLSLLDRHFCDERTLVAESHHAAQKLKEEAKAIASRLSRLLEVRSPAMTITSSKTALKDTDAQGPTSNQKVVGHALTKAAMDDWINGIRVNRRRLIIDGQHAVPLLIAKNDKQVVDAPNYSVMAPRLKGIKDQQDKIIDEVIGHIASDPASVRTRTENGQVSYFLSVGRPQWVQAFNDYQNDPALAKARDTAVTRSTRLGVAIEGERKRRVVDEPVLRAEPIVGSPKQETQHVQLRKPGTAPVNRALANAFMEAVRNGPIRVKMRDGEAVVSIRDPQFESAFANVDQNDADLQNRLIPVAAQQAREIKRMLAYAKLHPSRIVKENGKLILSIQSPTELVAFSRKWRDDEEVREGLSLVSQDMPNSAGDPLHSENVVRETENSTQHSLTFDNQIDVHARPTPTRALQAKPKPRLMSLPNVDRLIEEARLHAEAKRARRIKEERLGSQVGHPKGAQRPNIGLGADLER